MGDDQTFKIPMSNWYPRFVAWLFVLIGVILSAVSVQSCQFFKREILTGGATIPAIDFWGLYRYTVQGTYCSPLTLYEDSQNPTALDKFELDAPWKAAKAAGAAAPIFSGIALIMLTMQICRPIRKLKWIFMSVLCFISLILQGATFIVFLTDNCDQSTTDKQNNTSVKCSVEEGGNQAIGAMVFFLLAGITICLTKPPTTPLFTFITEDSEQEGNGGGNVINMTSVPQGGGEGGGTYVAGTEQPLQQHGGKLRAAGGKYGEA